MLERPIAFYPFLARELGDIESAIYYQQILYWSDKGSREDGYIYKTVKEIEEETTLTKKQQSRIRKKLIKLGWLEVKKKKANGAPTLHYLPIKQFSIVPKGTNGKCQKVTFESDQREHSLTETTTETTTKELFSSKENNKAKPFKEPKIKILPDEIMSSYDDRDHSFPRRRLFGDEKIDWTLDYLEYRLGRKFIGQEKWNRIYARHLANKYGMKVVRELIEKIADPSNWWHEKITSVAMLYRGADKILEKKQEKGTAKEIIKLYE